MIETFTLSFVLVLARVTAFIGFFPLFGQQQIPPLVKSGLATALAVFWFGGHDPYANMQMTLTPLTILMMIVKEIGIGMILAMLLGLILIPARIAGSYIGQEIGISMEPVTNTGSDSTTIMTAIFEAFTIMLFFILNIHHFLILFIHLSFDELTAQFDLFKLPTEGLVNMIGNLTEAGLAIAAPIGVLSFVTLFGLFYLSKAAPTLNLFSVGMPLRVGFGLLIMAVFVPVLWRSIESYFYSVLYELESFFGYFGVESS